MRTCSCCRQLLPASQFYTSRNPYGTAYLQSWCKDCKKLASRNRREPKPRTNRDWFPKIGQDSHKAKLRNEDIPLIRGLIDSGLSCTEIAGKFEVSRQTISGIKSGRTWTHV